ncbi:MULTISPECIES: hypothetical protein [unclassified Streptomyces]|uniref:hypothetical protein n=1 Tax=unclassified Streptomyces TaxID=2593676 RepID=UPI0035D7D044
MTLTDLSNGFRDDEQRRRVQAVIHDRLADDRDPQECRFLMRFWWQLSMPYREVSMQDLSLNIGQEKLDALEALINAIRSSPARIDAWTAGAEQAFPVVEDRGFRGSSGTESQDAGSLVDRRRQMGPQARLRKASWMFIAYLPMDPQAAEPKPGRRSSLSGPSRCLDRTQEMRAGARSSTRRPAGGDASGRTNGWHMPLEAGNYSVTSSDGIRSTGRPVRCAVGETDVM